MQENNFHFSKHLPNFGLVSKCMTAAQSGNISGLSRADFDTALDSVAKAVAIEEGVPFDDAFIALMEGEQGKMLYAAREACPASGPAPAVQKQDTTISKAEEMERAAEHFSQAYNVSLPEARKAVSEYYAAQ